MIGGGRTAFGFGGLPRPDDVEPGGEGVAERDCAPCTCDGTPLTLRFIGGWPGTGPGCPTFGSVPGANAMGGAAPLILFGGRMAGPLAGCICCSACAWGADCCWTCCGTGIGGRPSCGVCCVGAPGAPGAEGTVLVAGEPAALAVAASWFAGAVRPAADGPPVGAATPEAAAAAAASLCCFCKKVAWRIAAMCALYPPRYTLNASTRNAMASVVSVGESVVPWG